jgi:hypothetical protein
VNALLHRAARAETDSWVSLARLLFALGFLAGITVHPHVVGRVQAHVPGHGVVALTAVHLYADDAAAFTRAARE